MRVSPCAFAALTEEEAKLLSRIVTEVTHDHPEGIKGTEAVSVAIFMAKNGATKNEIRKRMEKDYYELDFTLDDIREALRKRIMGFLRSCKRLQLGFCHLNCEKYIMIGVNLGGGSLYRYKKFGILTKYIGRLADEKEIYSFKGEFYVYAQLHEEHGFVNYAKILEDTDVPRLLIVTDARCM